MKLYLHFDLLLLFIFGGYIFHGIVYRKSTKLNVQIRNRPSNMYTSRVEVYLLYQNLNYKKKKIDPKR